MAIELVETAVSRGISRGGGIVPSRVLGRLEAYSTRTV